MQRIIKIGMTSEQYENMMRKLESKNIVSLESTEPYSNFNQDSHAISYSISMTLKNDKKNIPLVNSINKQSSFNAGQIEFIKAFGGRYDTKTGYWFLSVR